MAALTKDTTRAYGATGKDNFTDLPVLASEVIYQGSFVGESSSTGYVRAFNDGDNFMGIAIAKADNTASGAANGDQLVRVQTDGEVELTVTGASVAALGETVYATTDNDFSLTDSGSDTPIGKVSRHVSGTTVMVRFQAAPSQSL